MEKITIYTCIIGDYDDLKPQPKVRDCELICFTDREDLKSDEWEIRLLDRSLDNAARLSRLPKILSHKFLADRRYTVWIDASGIILRDDFSDFVYSVLDKHPFSVLEHYHNDDIYHELRRCIDHGHDDAASMKTQVERYRQEGFPAQSGLAANGLIIRDHENEDVRTFNEMWWHELEGGSYRDQLSFPYVAWKLGMTYGKIEKKRLVKGEWVTPTVHFVKHKGVNSRLALLKKMIPQPVKRSLKSVLRPSKTKG